jgi:hypothetical protein
VLISTQDRCTVCARTFQRIRNHFGHNQWYSYVTWVKWKLVTVHLDIVLISTQDRSTVCAKCTIGPKSFWTHVIVLLGDVDQVKAHFDMFGDSSNFDARKVHSLR